ncbi:MAG: transporter permease, partial [Proteobacteria bacterium]|nr:transporter permease [Pseudomonadota bacterium]
MTDEARPRSAVGAPPQGGRIGRGTVPADCSSRTSAGSVLAAGNASGPAKPVLRRSLERVLHPFAPVLTVLGALGVVWYAAAAWLNAPQVIERVLADQPGWGLAELLPLTWSMQRPVLPAPHQIGLDLWRSIVDWPLNSPRSLLFHTGVTAASTLVGFVMGTLLGLALAVAIVHSRTLDRSLFPWIIASQTVPVLAVAPIVIVALGSMGLTGVFPKSVISMYLCFFPVTVAMVKGLRSPGVMELELM